MRARLPHPRRRAFTLLELMIVILIVGVLAGLTMPRLKGSFETAQLRRGSRAVAGTLQFARNLAVLRELPVEVRFDIDAARFELVLLDDYGERLDYDDLDRDDPARGMISRGDIGGVRSLPDRTRFSVIFTAAELTGDTARARVIFFPDGSCTPATIGVQGRGNRGFTVEVYQTTGMTRVETGLPEAPREEERPTLTYGGRS